MWWLVDNANVWYLLFGIVALGFAAAWWIERRHKYLLGVAVAAGFILGLWLLSKVVITDRGRLQMNLREMAAAVESGRPEALLQHFAQDFRYDNADRAEVARLVTDNAQRYKVGQVHLWNLSVEDVNRAKGSAKISFGVTVRDTAGAELFMGMCETTFGLEADRWKLRKAEFFNIAGDKTPRHIPLRH